MSATPGCSSKVRQSGLGKPSGKVHQIAALSPSSNSLPESPSGLPHLKTADNAKLLPKYSAALGRPANDTVPAEDLDLVQLELETLLSTVALRYRNLKAEYEVLDKADEKREKKGKLLDRQPSSPGKRKRTDEKPSKKSSQPKMSKMKNNPIPSPATDDSMDALLIKDNPKLLTHRNDLPNKFWLSVEPYCMPLTHEDIRLLDDLLEEYSGGVVPAIPELGPHYSSVWASEDLKEEHDIAKTKGKANSFHFMKRSDKIMGENVTGPLTQRLVSALMDENTMPDGTDSGSENTSSDVTSNRSFIPSMQNGILIERRVRKELIEQGILDGMDDVVKEEDDEILSEIKRVRTELAAIAEHNSNELKKLYGVAKEEMNRLDIKRQLDGVDQEVSKNF